MLASARCAGMTMPFLTIPCGIGAWPAERFDAR